MFKPEQMTIIIDTREQSPLDFQLASVSIPTVRESLPTGDYSVRGLEHHIAVERKSLPDLVACIGRERDRFERELHRLRAYESRLLVVEANYIDIETGQYRSKVAPNAVIGSLMAWQERFQIPVLMAGDHQRAGLYTARFLYSAVRRRWRELQNLREISPKSKKAVAKNK